MVRKKGIYIEVFYYDIVIIIYYSFKIFNNKFKEFMII